MSKKNFKFMLNEDQYESFLAKVPPSWSKQMFLTRLINYAIKSKRLKPSGPKRKEIAVQCLVTDEELEQLRKRVEELGFRSVGELLTRAILRIDLPGELRIKRKGE
jgi:hypothetical protein